MWSRVRAESERGAPIRERIHVNVLARSTLTSVDEGRALITLLDEHLPGLFPKKYGYYEPVRTPFDPSAIEEVWAPGFLWKGRARGAEGDVRMRRHEHEYHSYISLDAPPGAVDAEGAMRFAREASLRFEADFAYVQLVTAPEVDVSVRPTVVFTDIKTRTRPHLFVTTWELRECIPSLYWITILGAPYVAMFGADRLASAPAYRTEALGDGWYLQLCADLADFRDPDRHATIEQTRMQLKSHLGTEAFAPPTEPPHVPEEFRHLPRRDDPREQVLAFADGRNAVRVEPMTCAAGHGAWVVGVEPPDLVRQAAVAAGVALVVGGADEARCPKCGEPLATPR